MSSLVKFFTKRKDNKEKEHDRNREQAPDRNQSGRYSLRETSQKRQPHSNNSYVNTMAITNPEMWQNPAAPYQILTQPRTKRPVQSCPGGVSHPSRPPAYRANAKRDLSTHFEQELSPDFGGSVLSRPTTSNWPNQGDSQRNKVIPHRGGSFRPRNPAERSLQHSTGCLKNGIFGTFFLSII